MKTELVTKASRTLHKVGFKFKKHSPEILAVVGVTGTIASGVLACKATLKVNDIVDEAKETIETIHDAVENHRHTSDGEEYTEEVAKKDLTIVYAQTSVKFIKLYGPAVALGIASIGCMIGSNHILRKRNIALAAAFKAVDTSFKEYRSRLIDKFGKDLDRELRFGIKAKEVEETVVDENGKETTAKKTIEVADPNVTHSIYSIPWYEGNTGYTKNAELNKVFLIQQQNYANDKLKMNGILTLNEVYDMLGIPRTKAGQVVGWFYDEKDPNHDNFVDFGIFDVTKEGSRDFVNGYERTILLDFNVDGPIIDRI